MSADVKYKLLKYFFDEFGTATVVIFQHLMDESTRSPCAEFEKDSILVIWWCFQLSRLCKIWKCEPLFGQDRGVAD